MDVDLIFKIAAIGIVVSALNLLLRHSGREELAMMTTIVSIVVVLMLVMSLISNLFTAVKTMFQLY